MPSKFVSSNIVLSLTFCVWCEHHWVIMDTSQMRMPLMRTHFQGSMPKILPSERKMLYSLSLSLLPSLPPFLPPSLSPSPFLPPSPVAVYLNPISSPFSIMMKTTPTMRYIYDIQCTYTCTYLSIQTTTCIYMWLGYVLYWCLYWQWSRS